MSNGKELLALDQADLLLTNPNVISPNEYITSSEYEQLLTETWTNLEAINRNGSVEDIIRISETQAAKIIEYWQKRLTLFQEVSAAPKNIEPHRSRFGDVQTRATWVAAYNDEALMFQADYLGGGYFRATLERGLEESGRDYDNITFIGNKDNISLDDLSLTSLVGGEGIYFFKTKCLIHFMNGRISSFNRVERRSKEADGLTLHTDFEGNINLSIKSESEADDEQYGYEEDEI